MSSKEQGYNSDPSTKNAPLRLDEVEAYLLSGAKLFKDPSTITHFLNRVAATLKEHRRRIIDLQQDVDRLKIRKQEESHPVARALEALEALSEEDKRKLLDINYLDALDQLKEKEEVAERTRVATISETNRMRMSFSKLIQDPTIPTEIRNKIKSILDISK